MNGFRSAYALGFVVLLGGLLAGCSDTDEKNEYVERINELQTEYQGEIGAAGVPSSLAEVRELATTGAELDARLAADVAAVEPPDEVADLHAELVAALEESAATTAELEQVVTSTKNRQELQRAIAQADRNSQATINEFNSLIDRINEEL